MSTRTLPRRRLAGAGWAHPYTSQFILYADGGDPVVPPVPAAPPVPPVVPPVPAVPPVAPAADPAAEIARLTKAVADANAEAAKGRVNAKATAAAEARAELLKLLSGDSPEPLTPEQLQQKLSKAEKTGNQAVQAAAAAAIELTVYKTAQRLGANADQLLDSRSFCDAVDALDATDPAAFKTALEAQITATLTANPALRGRTAGRSSADTGGGTGGSGDLPDGIDQQIADATAKRDFPTVIRLKRLKHAAATT